MLTATSYPQILRSPGYPSPYPNDANCSWSISSGSATALIDLKIFFFQTEANYDFLHISDYIGGLNETLSGSHNFLSYQGLDLLQLHFVSDFSTNGRGFLAMYSLGKYYQQRVNRSSLSLVSIAKYCCV